MFVSQNTHKKKAIPHLIVFFYSPVHALYDNNAYENITPELDSINDYVARKSRIFRYDLSIYVADLTIKVRITTESI